ncbi:MAG: glycosyltransferase, partial [Ferruginibacter sp.]
KSREFFSWNILIQLPKLYSAVRNEHKWLRKIIAEYKIDLVISDNRYGLYNDKVPCIFITHQLQILTGNKLLNRLVQKINYAFIEKFVECWVPDIEKDAGVAGVLSHPIKLPNIQVTYIGMLSRFSKTAVQKKYDLLILLSGPEPQRSILEAMLLQQVKNTTLQILVVRGLPGEEINIESPSGSVQILSHLPANDLNQVIQESENVISRAGYSTIMDLLVLEKKAILIPTPGQKEQEYLAEYLSEKKWFYSCAQENFNLSQAIKLAVQPPINSINNHFPLKENIERLLSQIKVLNLQQ